MKLPLLVFALLLSLHGWCISIAPSHHASGAVSPAAAILKKGTRGRQIGVPSLQQTDDSLLSDKIKAVAILFGLLAYFTAITWWVVATKNSLDKILEDVLKDIASYP